MTFRDFFFLVTQGAEVPLDRWSGTLSAQIPGSPRTDPEFHEERSDD